MREQGLGEAIRTEYYPLDPDTDKAVLLFKIDEQPLGPIERLVFDPEQNAMVLRREELTLQNYAGINLDEVQQHKEEQTNTIAMLRRVINESIPGYEKLFAQIGNCSRILMPTGKLKEMAFFASPEAFDELGQICLTRLDKWEACILRSNAMPEELNQPFQITKEPSLISLGDWQTGYSQMEAITSAKAAFNAEYRIFQQHLAVKEFIELLYKQLVVEKEFSPWEDRLIDALTAKNIVGIFLYQICV